MSVFSCSRDEGHTVVGMTEAVMEDMGLFEGDTVSIKGKRGKRTMASVAVLDESDVTALADGTSESAAIGLSMDAMRNAGVRAGDKVTVVPAPTVKFGKAVLVLPKAESLQLAGVENMEAANLFDDYLKPYFEGKFRALFRGDSFHIGGPNLNYLASKLILSRSTATQPVLS
jgi:transitional endoplasmic reticulum ATPase